MPGRVGGGKERTMVHRYKKHVTCGFVCVAVYAAVRDRGVCHSFDSRLISPPVMSSHIIIRSFTFHANKSPSCFT